MFKTLSLTPKIKEIIIDKGTERPDLKCGIKQQEGSYLCRNCGIALFSSINKFNSLTGWPSFDLSYENNVKELLDKDQRRTEILCRHCDAHLGHVFYGESFTKQNARYCVNDIALDFVAHNNVNEAEEIIVAGGCFWGVEYYFRKLNGVLKTEVGYIGGKKQSPSYEDICQGNSGHYEGVRILFDPNIITLEQVLKYFFEIHDFTQSTGQGNDIGQQYKSRIFYYDDEQKQIALNLIDALSVMNYKVATEIFDMSVFWPAEEYHQAYYNKNGQLPYCHIHRKIF